MNSFHILFHNTRMAQNNLKNFFTFLIIFAIMNFVKNETALIDISSSNIKVISFYTSFDSRSIEKSDYYQQESFLLVGKICNAYSIEKIVLDCFYKYENYNYNWVKYILTRNRLF